MSGQVVVQAAIALLAITNPIGAVPIFLEITRGSGESRRAAAVRATLAVVIILTVVVVAGNYVLEFFGISVDALRAAGGLIILLMGLEMLGGSASRLQGHAGGPAATSGADDDGDDSLIVPFAMPLVAGPGAIATAVTLAARQDTVAGIGAVLLGVLAVGVVLLVALASSDFIGRRISRRGHAILIRFLGLILASIGAQSLLEGAQAVLAAVS